MLVRNFYIEIPPFLFVSHERGERSSSYHWRVGVKGVDKMDNGRMGCGATSSSRKMSSNFMTTLMGSEVTCH